jgi:hypothetical protein
MRWWAGEWRGVYIDDDDRHDLRGYGVQATMAANSNLSTVLLSIGWSRFRVCIVLAEGAEVVDRSALL